MWLKILLPSRIFVYKTKVLNIVAESTNGAFGILPQRRDCIASIVPGILSYMTATNEEMFIAVDTGLLVKNGAQVLVSVRRAVGPGPLSELRTLVDTEFLSLNEQERDLKMVLNKLESGFLAHFSDVSKV
ncbi:MAG: F-type H+-transporting ATPase subunit epsilon [Patiriisocius sp.]|jgi:F-type H+-transporting ATPase subunit epsilon